MNKNFAVRSYISPKIEIRRSEIHGDGMFAKDSFQIGEIAFIKGGHILTKNEIFSLDHISSYLPIDDEFYIGARINEEEEYIKLFNNHSCNPNCGLRGEITFVTLREIKKGEELTCDYAMIDNEDYKFECNCNSEGCRKIVTGFDWKIQELQHKYSGYFARYLQEKINNLASHSK